MKETTPTVPEQQTTRYLDAGSAIETILSSDVFDEKRKSGISAEHALVLTAKQVSRDMRSQGDLDPEARKQADSLAILGHLDDFTHGLEALRHHHHNEQLGSRASKRAKLRLVGFNHAVQDMLDNDPTIEFDEIVGFLSDMHGVINRSRWGEDTEGWHKEAAWFRQQLERTVHGMQQEIFGEQIASHIPGVTVERPEDPRDDLRGIDRWVTKDGVRFPVDFKASYSTAQKARGKVSHPDQIVYTGVEGQRFRKALRLDTRDIDMRTEQMARQLDRAKEAYIAHRAQRFAREAMKTELPEAA